MPLGRATTAAAMVAAAMAWGCSRDDTSAAQRPAPGPAGSVNARTAHAVPVTVHGKPAAEIVASQLLGTTPDFDDGADSKAWKLAKALGAEVAPGDVAVVTGEDGVSVTYRLPRDDSERQPVLYVTRRGALAVTVLDPKDPFPGFHGKGGQLGRPGDPTPRVLSIRTIDISAAQSADQDSPAADETIEAAKKSMAALEIAVDGKALTGFDAASVPLTVVGDDHANRRPTWSLRELALACAGPGARVVALTGASGERHEIALALWRDSSRTPILRGNRRGLLKFHWLAESGEVGPTQLREVSRVDIEAARTP